MKYEILMNIIMIVVMTVLIIAIALIILAKLNSDPNILILNSII